MKSLIHKTVAAVILASPLSAMTPEDDTAPTGGVAPSILAHVMELRESEHFDRVTYADLDGNLDLEAVIFLKTGPDPEDPELKEWRVLDEQDGSVVQVGTWYGTDAEVVETQPAVKGDPVVSAVQSDGSLWFLYKSKMRPFGDITGARAKFIHQGRPGDEYLWSDFGYEDVPLRYMARLTVDLTEERMDEVLISLVGDGFWRDDDGATPYVLMSGDGEVIHRGWSFMHPNIYELPEGGFQIMENINGGYRSIYFPEDAE